jgi:amicyanin
MSSLLRERSILGRSAPGRVWLATMVALALLTTVLALAAAGRAVPGGVASLTTTSAGTNAAKAAASGPVAQAPAAGSPATHSMSAGAAAAATKTVDIMNNKYSPATLTINVGDTVTWTNMDTAPHTVTVTSGPVKFSSGNLAKGQSFTYTFTAAGTYNYYCAVHPDMVAKVVVAGSSAPPTPTPTPTPTEDPEPTMPPMPAACGGLQAAVDSFMQHFYAAHLETSLLQQVQDALAVDQYAKTHTVLVENMLKPLLGGAQSTVDVFLQHVYAAHLETSPTQQVADALALDQYIKTHTVMIENMVKPLLGGDVSSC